MTTSYLFAFILSSAVSITILIQRIQKANYNHCLNKTMLVQHHSNYVCHKGMHSFNKYISILGTIQTIFLGEKVPSIFHLST